MMPDSVQLYQEGPMRVMMCVDHSDSARNAFEYYVSHVHHAENKLVILHVSDRVKMPAYLYATGAFATGIYTTPGDHTGMQEAVRDLQKANTALEEKYRAYCQQLGIEHDFLLVFEETSGPASTIVEQAERHGVGLIVLGSRGHGKVRRTVFGSVSDYVAQNTHVPSLVCPSMP